MRQLRRGRGISIPTGEHQISPAAPGAAGHFEGGNIYVCESAKGQKISLTKGNEGLSKVIIGLGWDEAAKSKGGLFGSLFGSSGPAIDCDASAFVLQNGKLTDKKDIVYFGNLKHYTGTVQHMGDNLTGAGEGDDEQIVVDLARVPAEYDRIVLVVNIYQAVQRRQHFGMIQNAFIRIVDARNNQEMCRYNLRELRQHDRHDLRRGLSQQRRVEVQRHRPGHHGSRPGWSWPGAICERRPQKDIENLNRGRGLLCAGPLPAANGCNNHAF